MPERFLDVSHEALIRGWPRLRRWLDEDRAGLRLQRRITETAEEWQRSNRDNDLLYRGARLIQAQEWRARHEMELNPLEREFLDASIALKQRLEEHDTEQQQRELEAAQKLAEAEQRRAEEQIKARRRQRHLIYWAVTFGCVAAIVVAIVAVLGRGVAIVGELKAKFAEKKTSEVASRGNVSLARNSKEGGKNAQALAYLAQALRLNPENREAFGITAAMLTQLSWQVPITGSMRHDAFVNSAHFSPDGQRVVTASSDKTARVWDAASGKQIGESMEHAGAVRSAQFSPDGQRVVTVSNAKTAQVWDAASGKQIGEPIEHKGFVNSAQFSPDGQRVVTVSSDRTARVWDAGNGKQIGEPMEPKDAVWSAQFSPDGQRVVTASSDRTARVWDAASGKQIAEPMEHKDAVNSAQFSPDGHRVVTASSDRTARVWDAASGKQIGEPMEHKERVNSAQFSPDGQRVVTVSNDRTVRVWDAGSGKQIGPINHKDEFWSAQFSPDGQRVVTASSDNTARVWDAASGKQIAEPMEHKRAVNSARFSPDGQRVVTASNDKTARVWDAASGKQIGESMEHKGFVNSAQFSPDGQRVVTASRDNTARLWDTATTTDKDTKDDILLLAELAEATGGVTLETVGQAENLKLLTPEQIRASWETIAAKFMGPSSKMTPLQQFMKWSISDRRRRTISPFSQVKVSEWLENRIKEGTIEGLRAALQVDPANARVTAHLGRRLADRAPNKASDALLLPLLASITDSIKRLGGQALEQGSGLDEVLRARGEADFLTRRALKLAPDNDEVKRLRDEVVKLLELKTD